MRNALRLALLLLPTIAVADERMRAPEGAVRVALAPVSAAPRSSPIEPVEFGRLLGRDGPAKPA